MWSLYQCNTKKVQRFSECPVAGEAQHILLLRNVDQVWLVFPVAQKQKGN